MAALTLGTLATAAAIGGSAGYAAKQRMKKKQAQSLLAAPAAPMDAKPSIPLGDLKGDAAEIEGSLFQAAGRRKQKRGHSGSLLTGPSGITSGGTYERRTLIGS